VVDWLSPVHTADNCRAKSKILLFTVIRGGQRFFVRVIPADNVYLSDRYNAALLAILFLQKRGQRWLANDAKCLASLFRSPADGQQGTAGKAPKNKCLFIIPARTEFSARTNLFFIFYSLKKPL
jgi:hypothetical protein